MHLYKKLDDKPVGYPSTYGDDPNHKVSSLSSDGQTGGMGPSLLVKVERGAELSVSAEYFYKEEIEGSTYESMGMFVNQILAGLASNATGVLPLSEAALMEMTAGQGEYFDEVFNFLSSSMDPENLTKPQAYLVYLFYDLNMNLVENGSGILRVQDPNDLGLLKEEQIIAKEAGYFYTYLLNSSGSEVNFDEYKVTYIRPKVRAINHYYPYGLQMYGLDQLDKDYTYKYGGKELQSGDILDNNSTGLELYDIEARYYDPATGLWHVPDPAEQFHNPYLAMGRTKREELLQWSNLASGQFAGEAVVYVDENGEFVGIVVTLATVVITATSTAATIAAIAAPIITLGLVATAAVASGTFATAASTATAAIPPDGYLWDPAKPNKLQWQNTQGRSEGLDYITNTQTGETITRPMHTNFAEINPTGDLPGRFSLNTKMTVNFPKIGSLPASPLSPNIAAPSLQTVSAAGNFQTGLNAFEAANAVKMQLLNYAGGAKAVPGWYMTGMTRIGQAGALANMGLSYLQYQNHEISGAKFTYDIGWSALGTSPNPYAQLWYWSGVAGQYWGPSTWGWDIFGPESYYGRFKYWIHKP